MPGRADGGRHLVVQRRPDQRMTERQAVAGFGQHSDGTCLVHRRDQVRYASAQHDGQIGDREVRAEQGRRLQHFAHRTGHEADAIGYDRGQGAWHGIAGHFGATGPGDAQP